MQILRRQQKIKDNSLKEGTRLQKQKPGRGRWESKAVPTSGLDGDNSNQENALKYNKLSLTLLEIFELICDYLSTFNNQQVMRQTILSAFVACSLVLLCAATVTTFDGEYGVTKIGTQSFSGKVWITIDANSLVVTGCRTHFATFAVSASGQVTVATLLSKGPACDDTLEKKILTAISGSSTVAKIGTVLTFRSITGAITVQCDASISGGPSNITPVNPIGYLPFYFSGNYRFDVVGFTNTKFLGTFEKDVLVITGCNIHRIPYSAFTDGKIKFSAGTSTRRQCIVDWDSEILQALFKVTSFAEGNGVYLFSVNGQVTVNAVVVQPPPIQPTPQFTFQGGNEYELSSYTQSGKISLYFETDSSGKYFVVVGCNTHRIRYQADEAGNLKFFPGTSTTKYCIIDSDKTFLDSLLLVNRYQSNSNGYAFFQGQTALLSAVRVQTPIPPPVQPTPQFTFEAGIEYTLSTYSSSNTVSLSFETDSTGKRFLIVTGCNIHRLPYQADEGGRFSASAGTSTRRACQNDWDKEFLDSLLQANRYTATSDGYIFYDGQTAILEAVKIDDVISLPTVTLQGDYTLTVDGVVVEIQEGKFTILGCNTHSFTYTEITGGLSGVIEFGPVASTKKACQFDDDKIYLDLILRSYRYQIDAALNQIEFLDSTGKTTIVFTNWFNEVPTPQHLEGAYKTQLPQIIAPMNITSTTITIKGCNTNTFTYRALEDGTISFGPVASTKKACPQDYDSIYVNSVIRSKRYENQNPDLTLYFQSEDKTITWAIGKLDSNLVIEPPIYPLPNIVPLDQGNYKIRIIGSNLPTLPFTISRNTDGTDSFGFVGCNSNIYTYQAYSDGQLQVSSTGISTLKFCADDKDSFYGGLLAKSVYYRRNGDRYILSDSKEKDLIELIFVY